ncbi:triose-phosphate isomerase [Alphaproteobacteria bacterium]|nr:triose-phosphate isomerase [Alphaproteobacteria bacterium]
MIYAANWKMNGDLSFVLSILSEIKAEIIPNLSNDSSIILCPPFIHLNAVLNETENSSIKIGAQDCSAHQNGAYTGEISASMIKDIGSDWVIIGHSERRQYHNENNALLSQKLIAAEQSSLKVIFCIGETHEQYIAGETQKILAEQLSAISEIQPSDLEFIIAYEPVWAIGTGLVPTLDEINQVHSFVKLHLSKITQRSINYPVLYGGSVNPENANQIKALTEVDGVLVGGASLRCEKFKQICL